MFRKAVLISLVGFSGTAIAQGHQFGIGLASSYDGRYVPAATALVSSDSYALSASMAGVATKAYYHNSYTLSLLRWVPMGERWFGRVSAGFGVGSHMGVKAYHTDPAGNGEEVTNHDFDIGPAFRFTVNPFWKIFFAFDYVMGLGHGTFGLGFADTGTFAIGAHL